MPIAYEIDSGAGIVRVTMNGRLTAAEFNAYLRATREDPAFRPDMKRLIVTQNIESFPSGPEMQAIAQETRARSASPRVRFAVVATAPLAVGMANMLLLQAGLDERFETFTTEAAARAWLLG